MSRHFEIIQLDRICYFVLDYIKIADNVLVGLIMRYNTLYGTYQSLLSEMNTKSQNVSCASFRWDEGRRREWGIPCHGVRPTKLVLYKTRWWGVVLCKGRTFSWLICMCGVRPFMHTASTRSSDRLALTRYPRVCPYLSRLALRA